MITDVANSTLEFWFWIQQKHSLPNILTVFLQFNCLYIHRYIPSHVSIPKHAFIHLSYIRITLRFFYVMM